MSKNSDDDSILQDRLWPLIPEGDYRMIFTGHETDITFGTAKVYAHFQIIEPGPYLEKVLYRAFNAKELLGKHGKNGRFKVGKRSELFLVLCNLYERSDKNLRPDRVSLAGLKNTVIEASVRTVTKDYKQRPLPECLRYSVIGELKNIEVGSYL